MTTKTAPGAPRTAALNSLMNLMTRKRIGPEWAKAAATRYSKRPEVWAFVLSLLEAPRIR